MPQSLHRRRFIKSLSITSLGFLPAGNLIAGLINPKQSYLAENYTLVDYACRVLQYQSLLYLEFYFCNVRYNSTTRELTPLCLADNVQLRSYMIVRLPQQHIAEEFFTETEIRTQSPVYAHTVISGYSFLAFEIDFEKARDCKLPIDTATLMNWNARYFRLAVRDDPQKSLFDIQEKSGNGKVVNQYPLGYKNKGFDRNAFPKYYPRRYDETAQAIPNKSQDPCVDTRFLISDADPTTAIEAPYRLILSPRLPDKDAYRFNWIFSYPSRPKSEKEPNTTEAELWTATLRVRRRKTGKQATRLSKDEINKSFINEGDNQMELMLIGSPDDNLPLSQRKASVSPPDRKEYEEPEKCGFKKLPCSQDRNELVFLFLSRGIPARAPSLSFSPLGISTKIAFRNSSFERNKVPLFEWNQEISYGRDQKVTVSRIVVDATFGLKMLHIQTTNRETYQSQSVLIYREFIMPLESEKDFSLYENNANINEYKDGNWKFNTPFKKAGFTDMKAVQIIPIAELKDDLKVMAPTGFPAGSPDPFCDCTREKDGQMVVGFWPVTLDGKIVEWPMFFEDWHKEEKEEAPENEEVVLTADQKPRGTPFTKKIFILTSELSQSPGFAFNHVKNNAAQSFKDVYAELFPDIKPADIGGSFITFRNVLNERISALRNTRQTWQAIFEKSEDFELEKTEQFRNFLELTIAEIENDLRNRASKIRDQVIEEWNVFKRRALDAENTIINLISRVQLTMEKDVAMLTNGTGRNIFIDIQNKLELFKQEVLRDIETDYLRVLGRLLLYRDRIVAILEPLLQKTADFDLEELFRDHTSAVKDKISVYQFYLRKLKELDAAVDSFGFDHAYRLFLAKLPGKYVNAVKALIDGKMQNLKHCINELQHVEERVRGKIELFKKRVGFAVNHVEDELKELKKKLIAELGEGKWEAEYERLRKLYHDEVNRSVSALQTEYIIFKNNFRHFEAEFGDVKTRVFNFFDDYSCIQRLVCYSFKLISSLLFKSLCTGPQCTGLLPFLFRFFSVR